MRSLSTSVVAIALIPLGLAHFLGSARADGDPVSPVGSASASTPLLLAADSAASAQIASPAPSLSVASPPPRATSHAALPEKKKEPSIVALGGWGMGAPAPLVAGVRSSPLSFTWFGLSLVSFAGRGWFVPDQPGSSGYGRVGGRLSVVEAMPVSGWPLDLTADYGWRGHLGANHYCTFSAGLNTTLSVAFQHQFNVVNLPEASLGYLAQKDSFLIELGVLGGLSIAGRYAFGENLEKVRSDTPHSEFASTHYVRPYAGINAALVLAPILLGFTWRRTLLHQEQGAGTLDHGQGLACLNFLESKRGADLGACLTGDVFQGDSLHNASNTGPNVQAWSFRFGLAIAIAQLRVR